MNEWDKVYRDEVRRINREYDKVELIARNFANKALAKAREERHRAESNATTKEVSK